MGDRLGLAVTWMVLRSFFGQYRVFFLGGGGWFGKGAYSKFLSQEEKDLERERESPQCGERDPIQKNPGPGTAQFTAGSTGHTPFCILQCCTLGQ